MIDSGKSLPSKKFLSSQGFTLVEVLIAVTILAIGLVMVVEVMGRTQHALRISQNLVIASQLAEEQLTEAEMEVRQYHRLRFGSEKDTFETLGKSFDWTRTSNAYRDSSIEDETKLNQVRIQIDWRDGADRLNRMDVASLLLNREKKEGAVA